MNLLDEARQKRLAASTLKITGRDLRTEKKKLHLFSGPPGTGKTQAMKVLAKETGGCCAVTCFGETELKRDSLETCARQASRCQAAGRSQGIQFELGRAWLWYMEGTARCFDENRRVPRLSTDAVSFRCCCYLSIRFSMYRCCCYLNVFKYSLCL